LANTGCLASESRRTEEEFFHLFADSPVWETRETYSHCGMSVIGTHSRSLASGVSANRMKGTGAADMRIRRNLPGGFLDEPGWDLRHSASASSETDSCWAKGSCPDNLPSGARLVTCNKKTIPPYNKQLVFGVASTNGSFSGAPQQTVRFRWRVNKQLVFGGASTNR